MAGRDAEFVINLQRNSLNTAWGFRLQGGKEFGTFLSVQRVFNGSPADGHLQRGDIIVDVNNEDVSQWYQTQTQDLIQSVGLKLALVVTRGGVVPYAEARQPPSQSQPVPSFVRSPFGQQPPHAPSSHQQQQQQQHQQQQHQQHQQQQPLTSKTTLQFKPSPYSPPVQQPPRDLESSRPYAAAGATWTPQQQQPSTAAAAPANSFSAPLQVRTAQPSPKPYSFSPQKDDSFSQDQGARGYQPFGGSGQSQYQQDQTAGGGGGSGWTPNGRDTHQREDANFTQQPNYDDSNHVSHGRIQIAEGPAGHDDRNDRSHYEEGRQEEGEEGDDYQHLTVRDIKQMFNKPDQKGIRAVPRGRKTQTTWTRPPTEGSISPGGYGAPGPTPNQPSALAPKKPLTGAIRRGPPPSDDDYRQPYSPQPQPNYNQPRYESPPGGYGGYEAKQKSTLPINKMGGAYAGIVQPALPAKTPPSKSSQKGGAQKKKDFDPNQSAVLKVLLEEEERAKKHPNQREEEEEGEEEEKASRRPTQGQRQGQAQRQPQPQPPKQAPKQAQGSRLNDLLERDAAQIAPYKERQQSAYQDQYATPYNEPRTAAAHQEQPRSPQQQEPAAQPQQLYRSGPTTLRGGSGARQNQPGHNQTGYDHQGAFPQTQYVDGVPTSDF